MLCVSRSSLILAMSGMPAFLQILLTSCKTFKNRSGLNMAIMDKLGGDDIISAFRGLQHVLSQLFILLCKSWAYKKPGM